MEKKPRELTSPPTSLEISFPGAPALRRTPENTHVPPPRPPPPLIVLPLPAGPGNPPARRQPIRRLLRWLRPHPLACSSREHAQNAHICSPPCARAHTHSRPEVRNRNRPATAGRASNPQVGRPREKGRLSPALGVEGRHRLVGRLEEKRYFAFLWRSELQRKNVVVLISE